MGLTPVAQHPLVAGSTGHSSSLPGTVLRTQLAATQRRERCPGGAGTFGTGKASTCLARGRKQICSVGAQPAPFPVDGHAAPLSSAACFPHHLRAANFVLSPGQDLAPKGWAERRP